jgi:ubiquinone/menaquinone biosynthesis C-methylase UbiE
MTLDVTSSSSVPKRRMHALYDVHQVATTFDTDPFGIYAAARDAAISQVEPRLPTTARVLDVGCGTGLFLRNLRRHRPRAQLMGLDPSRDMLDCAAQRVDARFFRGDAAGAAGFVGAASLDLMAVHFVLSYVEPGSMFTTAREVVRVGGLVSVASTDFASFEVLQQAAQRLLGDATLAPSPVPRAELDLAGQAAAHGFRLVDHAVLDVPLRFDGVEELFHFGVRAGWLLQWAEVLHALLPRAEELQPFFPLVDRYRGVVVLAERL